jgi:hypothetical protein
MTLSGGGSFKNTELDSGNISLTWMRQEAQLVGLRASTPDLRLRMIDLEGLPRKSLQGNWRLLQPFFFKRPKRQVRSDQKIHASVLFKPSDYKPKASVPQEFIPFPPPLLWDDKDSPSQVMKLGPHWEKGVFDQMIAETMLRKLDEEVQFEFVHYIAFLARSREWIS